MGIKSLAISAAFAVSTVLTVAMPASASPITGGIATSGSVNTQWQGTGGATYSTFTGIKFSKVGKTYNGISGDMTVTDASGDLTTYLGASGAVKYLVNDLPSTGGPFTTIQDFYVITVGTSTLHFDLESIAPSFGTGPNGFTAASGGYAFSLTGGGEFYITDDEGYVSQGPTKASWTLGGSKTGTVFSWQSTANAVPEPASIALLGAGLAGLGLRRKKRAA